MATPMQTTVSPPTAAVTAAEKKSTDTEIANNDSATETTPTAATTGAAAVSQPETAIKTQPEPGTNSVDPNDTFQDRLKHAIGPRGYENCMRRSVQSVILYEAHRCVEARLPSLRPFQRKLAFFDQANALLDTLDFLHMHQKEEVMWRTATSKETLMPEVAWKRMRLIDRELVKLSEKVQPFIDKVKLSNEEEIGGATTSQQKERSTHMQSCDLLVQSWYETAARNEQPNESDPIRPRPLNWEHAHNNVILTFRMYYLGLDFDPTFPAPNPPKEIVVPAEKPKSGSSEQSYYIAVAGSGENEGQHQGMLENQGYGKGTNMSESNKNNKNIKNGSFEASGDQSSNNNSNDPIEQRRRVLSEVREHLNLLKEFEGIISQEDLNKRKRELFLALPPAPPPPQLSSFAPAGNSKKGTPNNGNKRNSKRKSNEMQSKPKIAHALLSDGSATKKVREEIKSITI